MTEVRQGRIIQSKVHKATPVVIDSVTYWWQPNVGGSNGKFNELVFEEGLGIVAMTCGVAYQSPLFDFTGLVNAVLHIRHNSTGQSASTPDYPNTHWGFFQMFGWVEAGKINWQVGPRSWKFSKPMRINRQSEGGKIRMPDGTLIPSLLRVHIDLVTWPGLTDPDPNVKNATLARWLPRWEVETA